jgi:uncharacterized protein (DUF2236 family)
MPKSSTAVPLVVKMLGSRGERARKLIATPREDEGFFANDSVARRVLASPTVALGALRCSIVEMLDPPSAVSLGQHSIARQDPFGRAMRSLTLIAMLVYGDKKTAKHASDVWFRIHERINGTLPASDQPYRALDLDNLLWIFMTGWHSFYISYQEFSPRTLTAEETDRYFAEGAAAGVMMGIPAYLIPDSHAKVVKYFSEVHDELVLTPEGLDIIDLLIRPPFRPLILAVGNPFLRLASIASVSTLPRELRRLGRFDHSRLVDVTARGLVRAAMWIGSIKVLFPFIAVVAPDVWAVVAQSERWAAAAARGELPTPVAAAPGSDVLIEAETTPEYEQRMWSHLSKA